MSKPPFEHLIDFARLVKPVLVRILNFTMRAYGNVKSYARLLFGLVETSFYGYWYALLVHKNETPPDTLVIVHAVNSDAGDRERFFARFANKVSKDSGCADIDLLLVASDAQPVTTYTALARMFGRRLNLQIFANAQALVEVGNVVASELSQGAADTKTLEQIQLSEKATGCLRPPFLSKNTAREYLKSIDPMGRFCAISFPTAGKQMELKSALTELAKRNPGWRFILLNDLIAVDGSLDELPPEILMPSRSGFDFLTRLCLAAEADAYIGAADVFGLAAYLALRPAYLLGSSSLPAVIIAKPGWMSEDAYRVPVDEVERLAADLFGASARG